MQRISKFFHNVIVELRKVRWPHRKELTKYTITVITTLIFFTIFFTLVDLGLTQIIELLP
ncbi:preprotein translocase subunit SecE [Caldifermentibacillus hisashii]|uniref:preprotein translocase subunit SecE n=1 Tax=Caldifermentibacillus hisashii TaxID=996558 RepID=UPI001C10C5AE|nr:preprotein translocase subunit SecE [Caldifermentibacillus hisashii]MBU5343948.1 preprotein translocase subunit SecE [Caldifermentibacillus hisashii]